MVIVYFKENNKLIVKEYSNLEFIDVNISKGSYIRVSEPNSILLEKISNITSIPIEFLNSSLDEEESARIDKEDDNTLIVLDSPYVIDKDKGLYSTAPFLITYNKDYYVTIESYDFHLLDEVIKRNKVIEPNKHIRLSLNLIYRLASIFIFYLKSIIQKVDLLEKNLRNSTKNKEVLELMDINKSLIYFSTALNGDKGVLTKLIKSKEFNEFEDDFDLMEDTRVELDQAIEMCSISRSVLDGMMDAFGSIINNNMNVIMKTLTVVTIVISIPSLVSSLFGMNVVLPFIDSSNTWAFWVILGISIVLSIICAIFLLNISKGRR